MNLNYIKFGTTALLLLLGTLILPAQQLTDHKGINLSDLSSFKEPGQTWSVVGSVTADLSTANKLNVTKGTGILVNIPDQNKGIDLLTAGVHGDIILELDYLMAKGSNSGIYLQGIYEVQLTDSWDVKILLSSSNGGIYERWDNSKAADQKGFGGFAPRQNASKAPGLWQHIKITFQAPRFDAAGIKVSNARILTTELNGVIIHDNVELPGPTRGANNKEKAFGALRLQGDHGAVAFRNIKISKLPANRLSSTQKGNSGTDPIYIDAITNTTTRSFIDIIPDQRITHAISVGSPKQLHYSYDLDNGFLLQAWRGEFIDATPMWDGRGNGTVKPRGAVTLFTRKPVPALAQLTSVQDAWPLDTTGSGFQPKGYVMDNEDRPQFKYNNYGAQVTDVIKVLENAQGINREITIDKPVENLYLLLASAADIREIADGLYLVDDQSFYLKFNTAQDKPVIRAANGRKEMIILLHGKLNYSVLF